MTPAVRVRPLRPGEEAAWYAVRPPRDGIGSAFTGQPGFRPEAHLLAERDGVPVGRMESILVEPEEAALVHPVAREGAAFDDVTDALVTEGLRVARSLAVRSVELLVLHSMPRPYDVLARAPSWGFAWHQSKGFFRVRAESVRWDLGALPAGLAFRPAAAADDPHLVRTLGRVFERSFEAAEDPAVFLASCTSRVRADGCLHPEDWQTLESPGGPLGVVVPAFADASHEAATNLHVGLVPEARGRGLGTAVHLHGLETLRRRGATRFIGSTDLRNTAMQRVFVRAGYAQTDVHHVLRRAHPG